MSMCFAPLSARKWLAHALLAASVLVAWGCGSKDPFSYVPVSGQVLYDDGTPLPTSVRVAFVSESPAVDGKYRPRNAYASTDQDGRFESVTSRQHGDGIVPGKHKVLILLQTDDAAKVVPPIYTDVRTTPLEVDAADAPFEFRIHKPG